MTVTCHHVGAHSPLTERSSNVANEDPLPTVVCHRFDSVTDLKRFCCVRYGTLDVHSCSEEHSFWVKVGFGDGRYARLLIVHSEGSRTYIVGLPTPMEIVGLLDSGAGASAATI